MFDVLVRECPSFQKSIGKLRRNNFIFGNGLRIFSITALFLFFAYTGSATTYYVSNSGSDSNSGTSSSSPWRTLVKVNSFYPKLGDRILFNRGDTFYGSITVKNSGVSGSPIVYGAYGTGSNPVISGFTTLSGWTYVGSSIYSKTIAVEDNFPNIVLVDGVNTAMGRYPNTGTWLTYESHSSYYSYTDNELTGSPNWTGAEAVIRKNRWILERDQITDHTNSTLTVSPEDVTYYAINNYGYFIQNDLKTLDVANEWYYNGYKFYIYANPSVKTVKISTLNKLMVMRGKDYITVENITFEGANSHAIQNTSGHDIIIQNCNFLNIGMSGIYTDASSVNATITIDGNTFNTSNNNAINLRGSNTFAWIKNNTIQNIGLIKGAATNVDLGISNAYDAIDVYGANSKIEYNTISNIGHSAIVLRKGAGMVVRYNYISNFGLTRYDAGGIYTYELPGSTINDNIVIGGNHVSEGITGTANLAGINIDEKSETCDIYNNTVANVNDFGIKYLNSRTGTIKNNTIYNNGTQFQFSYIYSYGFNVTGMDIEDNVFISKSASQRVMIYKNDTSPLNQWGVADNNYYARPIDDNHTINASTTTSLGTDITLEGWKNLTGQDVNSHTSPQTITSENDLQFEYNATKSAKTVSLSQPMIDVKGIKYATSVTLEPYTSIVLMKDANPALPDSPDENSSVNTTTTFGNTEVYGSTTTVPNRRAMPVTFSEAGNINSISVYHEGGTGRVLLGVYSDDSDSPGSLLGVTPGTTINSTAGWQTVSLMSPVAVNAGEKVWLSWVFENNPGIRYTTGTPTPGRAQSADTWSSGMPQTFGTADYADYRYSVYCNYTSGGSSIAGTLGHTEVYGSTTTVPNRRAMPVTFSETGNINSISVYHEGGTGRVLLGVYSDDSDSPGSLLGVTQATTINSTAGWQTVSLMSPVAVNAGQTVWLSWVFENNPGIRYTTGTPSRAQSAETWSSGMPQSFGTADYADYRYSVYCNYTSGGSSIAGTLGHTEVYGSTTTVPNRRAMPVTFSETGNINSISVYHEGGTGRVLLGVYSDDSDSPGSLLGVTQATTINSTAGWQTVSLMSPVAVNAGQTVWLSWVFENNPGIRYTTGTPGRAQSADTWSSGMPQTFGTADYADYRYSVYCNYTSGGGSIAGTLGHTEVYGSTTTVPNRRAMPVTFSEAGNINSISVYHEGGTTGRVLLGVYSDNSDSPGSLLGVTPATTINSTAGWQTVSLMSPVAVNSGQKVWLSWVFENNPGIRYTTGTPGRAQSADTWSSGMPQMFGTADYADYRYSVYCNYTVNTSILKDATIANIVQNESSISAENNTDMTMNSSVENSVYPQETVDFKIYPNPANAVVNVDFSILPESETRIIILDGTGRILANQLVDSYSNRIDISQCPTGLYYIKAVNSKMKIVKKLIIAK